MRQVNCIDTINGPGNPTEPFPTWREWFDAGARLSRREIRRAIATVGVWQQRSTQRRALSYLDDRALRDIGVDRIDADLEAAKPFWRA
jgi:uncharacterized protein YjiS (DUF1127 family)